MLCWRDGICTVRQWRPVLEFDIYLWFYPDQSELATCCSSRSSGASLSDWRSRNRRHGSEQRTLYHLVDTGSLAVTAISNIKECRGLGILGADIPARVIRRSISLVGSVGSMGCGGTSTLSAADMANMGTWPLVFGNLQCAGGDNALDGVDLGWRTMGFSTVYAMTLLRGGISPPELCATVTGSSIGLSAQGALDITITSVRFDVDDAD